MKTTRVTRRRGALAMMAMMGIVASMASSVFPIAAAHADDPTSATARPGGPGDLHDQIATRAGTRLPADLAVVAVTLSPSLARLAEKRDVQRLSISWRGAPRPGRVSIAVTAIADDGHAVRGWAQLSLRPLRPVVVALRELAADARIAPGDLGIRDLPVERGRGWNLRPHALNGSRVLRDVAAGQVIGAEDVEEPPPVRRGTWVSVVVRRGAVTVSTRGRLERSARPGAPAAVRLVGAGPLVRGLLVDRTTLALEQSTRSSAPALRAEATR